MQNSGHIALCMGWQNELTTLYVLLFLHFIYIGKSINKEWER